jgi:hypothetical protein
VIESALSHAQIRPIWEQPIMAESIRNALPMITGALFALALFLFVISLRLFRRSRRDVYWRNRRNAGQRGWRLFVVAFGLFSCGGMFCVFTILSLVLFDEDGVSSASPPTELALIVSTATMDGDQAITQSPSNTPEALASTPTAQPSPPPENLATPNVIIITATPVFTPTATLFPTFTPQFTPADSMITPLPNAEIRITALDDQITEGFTPINPRASFEAGVNRVYLFVEFRGMAKGILWRRALYRGDEWIDGGEYIWGQASEGTGYFFFGDDDGFEPGQYEIRLFIGQSDVPITIMPFTVFESP